MSKISAPKVLVSDALSETAVNIFKERGVEVVFEPALGKDKDKLMSMIDQFDGLAVRSATKATADLIAAGKKLKVIGRAGIGVDNVDIPAATAAGIVVMNTPYGNAITTAEHAIAMMFAENGKSQNSWEQSFTVKPLASLDVAILAVLLRSVVLDLECGSLPLIHF